MIIIFEILALSSVINHHLMYLPYGDLKSGGHPGTRLSAAWVAAPGASWRYRDPPAAPAPPGGRPAAGRAGSRQSGPAPRPAQAGAVAARPWRPGSLRRSRRGRTGGRAWRPAAGRTRIGRGWAPAGMFIADSTKVFHGPHE